MLHWTSALYRSQLSTHRNGLFVARDRRAASGTGWRVLGQVAEMEVGTAMLRPRCSGPAPRVRYPTRVDAARALGRAQGIELGSHLSVGETTHSVARTGTSDDGRHNGCNHYRRFTGFNDLFGCLAGHLAIDNLFNPFLPVSYVFAPKGLTQQICPIGQ